MKKYILAIDQGTTSSRVVLYDVKFKIKSIKQKEFKQYFPKDGCVEHDPEEIWETVLETSKNAIEQAKISSSEIAGIGITNQRETTVLWDKKTGKPVYNAIVWQDRRQEEYCEKLRKQNKETLIFNRTGLLIDSYFSGMKIKWILDNVPKAKLLMNKKQLLFGTIDSFLIWRFTKGKVHATDATNASRTMIYNISSNKWDDKILNLLKIKKHILPEVKDCADDYGSTHSSITGKSISISGVVGDQQSATIGQCCFEPGSLKSTYGTGAFVLLNTGNKIIYFLKIIIYKKIYNF